ncbi:MAG: hypothetical protein WBC44_10710 [Planctomycetaceae bacterium]
MPRSSPRASEASAPSPAKATTASEALTTAQARVTAAEREADRDPGEAFRLYAEAYSAVSAHSSDAACAALTERIVPRLRQSAARANAAAGLVGDKTLVEE